MKIKKYIKYTAITIICLIFFSLIIYAVTGLIWGASTPFKGNYYLDYIDLIDESIKISNPNKSIGNIQISGNFYKKIRINNLPELVVNSNRKFIFINTNAENTFQYKKYNKNAYILSNDTNLTLKKIELKLVEECIALIII